LSERAQWKQPAGHHAGAKPGRTHNQVKPGFSRNSRGYGTLNLDAYVSGLAKNKHFLKIYCEQLMQQWLDQNRNCPQNERLCGEAVWFTQNLLLGPREDMEQIANAIRKIQQHGAELTKA